MRRNKGEAGGPAIRVLGRPAWRLAAAVTISAYGDFLTTLALVVVLYRQTGSAAGPAGYMLARIAPRLVGPIPGGWLADRFSPQSVLAGSWAARGMLTVVLVAAVDRRQLGLMYVLVATGHLIGSAGKPCEAAIMPRIATCEELGRLNAIYTGVQDSAILVAPPLGALLVGPLGAGLLLLVDAASFAVGVLLLATLPGWAARITPAPGRSSEEGPTGALRFLGRSPLLRSLSMAFLACGAGVTVAQAVLVPAAAGNFGHANWVGYLYGAVGAGGIAGTLITARHPNITVPPKVLLVLASCELAPMIAFALTRTFAIGLVLLAASCLAGELYQIWGITLIQRHLPAEMIGRAMSLLFQAISIGMLLGATAAVTLVDRIGWAPTLIAVNAAGLVLLGLTSRNLHARTTTTSGQGAPDGRSLDDNLISVAA